MASYNHKELKEGEIFVFNTRSKKVPEHFSSLKTMRLGKQAFGTNNEKLDPKIIRPVFIHKSDQEEMDIIWEKRIRTFGR